MLSATLDEAAASGKYQYKTCVHGVRRTRCVKCQGGSICPHQTRRGSCKLCKNISRCPPPYCPLALDGSVEKALPKSGSLQSAVNSTGRREFHGPADVAFHSVPNAAPSTRTIWVGWDGKPQRGSKASHAQLNSRIDELKVRPRELGQDQHSRARQRLGDREPLCEGVVSNTVALSVEKAGSEATVAVNALVYAHPCETTLSQVQAM